MRMMVRGWRDEGMRDKNGGEMKGSKGECEKRGDDKNGGELREGEEGRQKFSENG